MSPYCPGRALSECPSSAAEELRLWIIQQENSGMSREFVESALFTRYGDILLQAPKAEGVGLIAYVVPGGLFVVIGLVGLVFILRRRQIMAVDLGKINPEVSKKIDEDLLNRDLKI
ncbi:cytochrome c-type biogenesis protein CcmH [Myxococcota bacterium]|jgi:cytochrome c-type biogenesis protein CcmH/NrfF|nr:cytochrome c-type biogenesis protein CcmH [Myxococcota bacterium]|tara:strand:- start:1892 stop:2239 length:348 start_codon:yes stop_codon:yes gene_type:complete